MMVVRRLGLGLHLLWMDQTTQRTTNKCLANNNKPCTAKANKRQEKFYKQRQFRASGQVSQRPSCG